MVIAFHASCVAIEDLNVCWQVAFADDKFATTRYLILERAYEVDEQSIRHGMNTYHVERDDQLWSCYGGIERFDLHRGHVVVRFTPSGAEQMKAKGMEITFEVDDLQFQKLKQRLDRIFVGSDCYVVKS